MIKKNPLFFAWLFPALVDASVTLIGQDKAYWTNKVVNEASPAYYALVISPWLFAVGSIVWFVGWYLIFKKLKEPYNLFLMFLFVIGHSWGSSSWFKKMLSLAGFYSIENQINTMIGWGTIILYFVLVSLWTTYCFRRYSVK